MGFINNQRGIQTGIFAKTPISRGEKDSNSTCSKTLFIKRGKRFIRKKCNRTCCKSREPNRFLQYIFPSTKKEWKNETNHKFETPQPVSQETTFQNGHFEQSVESSETKRLGNINRFNRCISTHTNFFKTPEVSQILCRKPLLSMENNVLRTNISTTGFYQNGVCSSSIFENTQCSSSSLPRRLAYCKPIKRKITSRSRKMPESIGFTRFHNQQREILSRSQTENCISGCFVSIQTKNSASFSGQIDKINTNNQNVNARSENSQRFPSVVGNSCFLYRSHSQCSSVYETHSATFTEFLETEFSRFRENNPYYSTSNSTSTVVVTFSEHFQGQIVATGRSRGNHNHRCIINRVWGSPEQSNSSREMGQTSQTPSYQLSRDGSSVFITEAFSKTNSEQNSFDQMRQHNCSSIHQQTRGNQVSSSLLPNMGVVELGNRPEYQAKSCSYSRKIKHFSRSIKQGKNQTNRMDVEEGNCTENFSNVGSSPDRYVCIHSQPSNSNLLHLVSSQSSICIRCSDNTLGGDVSICLSSDLSNTQSPSTYPTIQLSGNSNSPMLAKKTLVHRATSTSNFNTKKSSKHSKFTASTQHKNLSSKSRSTAVDCMASIDRGFKKKGFSKDTRTLLAASWRSGTQKDYSCKFKQFSSWCCSREIDPYSASLVEVANFLTDLYTKGLQYRTIAGYRSMLSSVLPPVDNVAVGQHPYIIRLIKGVFNSRPPKVRLVPEWNLPMVLDMLQRSPFEPITNATLKHLTYKTVFLTAITTFRRCSDLQSLRLGEGFINIQRKGVTFIRQGLAKQDRPNHYGTKIFVPAFSENKLLDPKRSLYFYVKKTEEYRQNLKTDNNKLFLSLLEPHQAVASQTISKWIVQTIHMAYENKKKSKVKGHSTRAIGPSWALFNGASMKSILESADWSKESTFCNFYLRDVDNCVPVLQCTVNS